MWAVPKTRHRGQRILCLHGGGFTAGSMYTHRKVYGHLAKAVGCRDGLSTRLEPLPT
jgi:acetyl esterase/lipase